VLSCFWLVVPILAFNVLFAHDLPRSYQGDAFRRDVPRAIAIPENVLRGLVLFLTALMPVAKAGARTRKVGVALYVAGTLVYVASWLVLMFFATSWWSASAVGFMAPTWTPILWLVGIVLISDERLAVPIRFYRRWMFVLLCVLFLFFHNLHSALVFTRERHAAERASHGILTRPATACVAMAQRMEPGWSGAAALWRETVERRDSMPANR
jgi:hypothetical protein